MKKYLAMLALVVMTRERGVFAEEQARDPRAFIRQELAQGAKKIVVPPGVYRLEQQDTVLFSLAGVKDTVIDCTGVTFIGLATTTMLQLDCCENVTVKGLTIDYDPLPFTQARICAIDADRNWDVEVLEGYPTEGLLGNADIQARVQVYDPNTDELVNPLRHSNGLSIKRLSDRRFRISGGGDRSGKVGDSAVFSARSCLPQFGMKNGCVVSRACTNLVFEEVTLYSAFFMGFVENGNRNTTYRRCVIDRCPPEKDYAVRALRRLRSLNVDGFHCKNASVGPKLIGCTARYMADDCVNISGMYSFVASAGGAGLRVLSSFYEAPEIFPGDELEVMTSGGRRLPGAKVLRITPEGRITPEESAALLPFGLMTFYKDSSSASMKNAFRIDTDCPVTAAFGDVVISAGRYGSGFAITGNTFGPVRSALLRLKASKGLIAGNTLIGAGDAGAIRLAPEYCWMEGGCSSDVIIENNLIRNSLCPAILIGGMPNNPNEPMPVNAHSNITIRNNTIVASVAPAIEVTGCTGLLIVSNAINVVKSNDKRAIELKNVEGLTKSANEITCVHGSPSE